MFPDVSRAAMAVALVIAPLPALADQTSTNVAAPAIEAPVSDVSGIEPPPVKSVEQPTSIRLPALTVVELKVMDEITSKTAVTGSPIRLTLARPIYLTTDLGIPQGTPVEGVVIHAARGGMGGKSGELLLGAKRIVLSNTANIPLRSFKLGPAKGLNNETLAFATAVTVGLPALFINGGSAKVPAGTVANAKTSADTEIDVALLSKLPPIPAVTARTAPAQNPHQQFTPTEGENQ